MISLSLSFHWWFIPLFIFLSGLVIAAYDYHTDNTVMQGFGGFLVFIMFTLLSCGITIGYFIVHLIK